MLPTYFQIPGAEATFTCTFMPQFQTICIVGEKVFLEGILIPLWPEKPNAYRSNYKQYECILLNQSQSIFKSTCPWLDGFPKHPGPLSSHSRRSMKEKYQRERGTVPNYVR